jgi:hypothetical protein
MTEGDLLEHILDRLGRADSAEEIFGADEAADWPAGALDLLIKAGLLRRAEPAQVIECNGCEQYCFMPVHVRPAEGNRPARAFVSCDKRDDIGRVPVEMRRLAQWKMTGGLLAKTLARLLGFLQAPQEDGAGKRWTLGMLKGNEHKAQIALAVANGVALKVAGHDIPLTEVLTFNKGKLAADKDELLRRADKPAPPLGASAFKPSAARREGRKLDTQKQYAAWQKSYKELKRNHRGMSDVWYSQQIAKQDIANNRDAETIRKHMKR